MCSDGALLHGAARDCRLHRAEQERAFFEFVTLNSVPQYRSYLLCGTDADRVQHEIVQEAADREQARVATDTRVIPTPLGAFRMKNHK